MTILTEGTTPTTFPTEANLGTWNGRAGAPYSMVLDSMGTQPRMERYFNRPRDTFILVELPSMRILEITASDVNSALASLRMRLGS
ncbi:MAG: hypothetical protein HY909_21490 [Deltaproteobacteria bacterium]|nr:hypothetical protein [Deltaproteobacteria bacterium]